MAKTTRTLSDQDLVEKLEEIIRDGRNGAARIAAIKQLREMCPETEEQDPFGDLDGDELAPRRAAKSGGKKRAAAG